MISLISTSCYVHLVCSLFQVRLNTLCEIFKAQKEDGNRENKILKALLRSSI